MFQHSNPAFGPVAENATLIGIDPGSESLGVSILTFNPALEIVRIEAATYRGSKLPISEDTELVHGARHARIRAHYQNLVPLLLHYQPIGIVCESPFFQATRPQAYGALTEVLTMVRSAVHTYRPNLEVALIDPPTVKRSVGAKGNAGKEDVRLAILAIADEMHYHGPIPLERLDEHSLDATAVVYGYFKVLRGE
jgi:Holliday junction resolvasome RuvABC endonuclease subunit